jgi:replicative DNA helicase
MPNKKENAKYELPSDIEAEKALLGNILVRGEYSHDLVDEIGDKLQSNAFYDLKNQIIYQAIIDLWLAQQSVDSVHVLDVIKRKYPDYINNGDIDQSYLMQLIAKSSLISDPIDTVKLINEKYTLRMLISISEEMRLSGFRQDMLPNEILDQAQKKLYDISLGSSEKNFVHIGDVLGSGIEKFQLFNESNSGPVGVETGFTDLDKKLGGLKKSDLLILACRPSMGKTALSLAIAKNIVEKDIGVAYFSLEMSAEQLCERLLAATAKVDLHRIRNTSQNDDAHNNAYKNIGQAFAKMNSWPLWIDDTGGANIVQIRSKARRLKQRHNIGLIVIDYLQLMSGGNEKAYSNNRVQEISDISRNLKLLAKDLNVPILALSQLSRKVESRDDKKPVLSDLRESGSIEQDADIVMMLYRESYYKKESELKEEDRGKAQVIIAKNRNGETGFVELAWLAHFATFDNLYQGKVSNRVEK